MVDPLTIAVIAGAWLFSLIWGLLVVAKRASRWTLEGLGLVEVEQDGATILAAMDPAGNPIKVPVAVQGDDGKIRTEMRYAPLAYALPTIAAMQIKATFTGKVGNLKQQAEAFARGELPIEQAAQAAALDAFARGQYGKAIANLVLPSVVNAIRSRGMPGETQIEGQGASRQGGRPI